MPSIERQAQRIADTYQPPDTGRHSDLTDSVLVTNLLTLIAQGNYVETACKAAGLSKNTVYRWLKEADEPGEHRNPQRLFRDALERAEGMSEAQEVAKVRKAGELPQFWAASMTYLERKYPEKWGRRQDSQDGPKVVVQIGIRDSDVQLVQITTTSAPQLENTND